MRAMTASANALRGQGATEVCGLLTVEQGTVVGVLDPARGHATRLVPPASVQVIQEHHATHHQGQWIGHSLTGNVRSGSMNGLEHRRLDSVIRARGHSESTHQAGTQVAQHVTVEIFAEDDVEIGRFLDEPHAPGIDDPFVVLDVGIRLAAASVHGRR